MNEHLHDIVQAEQSRRHLSRRITDSLAVTRSHKANDRDHAGLAAGTALPEEHLPRYFAKSGYSDADPKKTKKSGAGRGNWSVVKGKGFVHSSDF